MASLLVSLRNMIIDRLSYHATSFAGVVSRVRPSHVASLPKNSPAPAAAVFCGEAELRSVREVNKSINPRLLREDALVDRENAFAT